MACCVPPEASVSTPRLNYTLAWIDGNQPVTTWCDSPSYPTVSTGVSEVWLPPRFHVCLWGTNTTVCDYSCALLGSQQRTDYRWFPPPNEHPI